MKLEYNKVISQKLDIYDDDEYKKRKEKKRRQDKEILGRSEWVYNLWYLHLKLCLEMEEKEIPIRLRKKYSWIAKPKGGISSISGNPAGLGFLEGSELAMMHVNWLPNLADDLYYDFFAFRRHVPNLGTFGGHLIYLSLGEQIRMGETALDYLGTFTSFMTAATVSYSSLLSQNSSMSRSTHHLK